MASQAEQRHDGPGAGLAHIWRVVWQERSPVAASRIATAGALLLLVAAWAPLANWALSTADTPARVGVNGAVGIRYVLPHFSLYRSLIWAPMLWEPIFIAAVCLAGALWLAPQTWRLARVMRAMTALWLILATVAMGVALYGVLIFPTANAEICQGLCGEPIEMQAAWGAWVAVAGILTAWLGAMTLLRSRTQHAQSPA